MIRVGIYVRLSDEDRKKRSVTDESESIQNQKSMLLNYCIEREWQIYNIYCDEDYSGADKNRPEWNRMIQDCEDGKINVVLCKTQSRFSRDMEMVEKYIHNRFLEWGVRFISVIDNADTSVIGNKKSRQINGLVNEWYLEDLSENIRRTLNHKKRNGQWTGSFAPYGYMIDPEDKNHLIIDPIASEIVKEIFQMFADGKGYILIAKELNERGILNPTLYKRQNGINYKTQEKHITSTMWTDSTIFYLLRQEVYLGTLVQGKTHNISYKNKKRMSVPKNQWIRCEDTHDPIIDQELWNIVRSRLKVKSRSSFANVNDSGKRHVLSGKVFCAECGNTMIKISSQSGEVRYQYLKCKTTKNNKDVCENYSHLRLDYLEEKVLEEINLMISQYYNPDLIELPSVKKSHKRSSTLEIERESVWSELESMKKMCSNLYKDKLKEIISEEQFVLYNNEFYEQTQKLQTRLDTIESELAKVSEKLKCEHSKEELLSKYRRIEKLTHSVANEFIDAIYIGKKTENRAREIRIEWNF